MKLKSIPLAALFCSAIAIAPCGASTLIAYAFDGDGSDLNNKIAPTFSQAITDAGGSSTWSAAATFNANGTVVGNGSAGLNLGTYISDTKGNANGLFTFTSTISAVTGSSGVSTWITMNLFNTNADSSIGSAFGPNARVFESPNEGVGIVIRRAAEDVTYFDKTPQGSGTVDTDWATVTEDVTFTVELDLRTWDGISNFGSLRFFRSGTTGVQETKSIPEDFNFSHIGFSASGTPTGTISNFSLSQIPEPSSSLLALLGGVALLRRRR